MDVSAWAPFRPGPATPLRASSSQSRALRIKLSVNGEVMQDESVDDIIYGFERLIAYASTIVVLQPGDLILTGSPAGTPVITATGGFSPAT